MPLVKEADEVATGDIIDVRDVITRVEWLEQEIELWPEDDKESEEHGEREEELKKLTSFLEDLQGYGGDHQWRGNWYPVVLINDSHFEAYAQEYAEETGAINANASWPNNCIDWEKAANELQTDYSSVEFDGETYWYR
jgi:hypothetical protein